PLTLTSERRDRLPGAPGLSPSWVDGLELFLRSHDRLGAVAHTESAKDCKQMHLDGALGQAEFAGDQLVRQAACQQAEHVELALRKAVRCRLPGRRVGAV